MEESDEIMISTMLKTMLIGAIIIFLGVFLNIRRNNWSQSNKSQLVWRCVNHDPKHYGSSGDELRELTKEHGCVWELAGEGGWKRD